MLITATLSIFATLSPLGGSLARPPECRVLLDGLRAKIEANYAGFRLGVTGQRRVEHDRALADLQTLASLVDRPGCLGLLRSYVQWFEDPHLFLFESTRVDSAETSRRLGELTLQPVEEAAVLKGLAVRGGGDPIEGVWSDDGMRLAVVPDPATGEGAFFAIVTRSAVATLPVGTVRARIQRQEDGGYRFRLLAPSLAVTHPVGRIYRGTVLRLSPGMWGKVAPVAPADAELRDSVDVHRPTLVVRGEAVIVTIPSHQYQYKAVLDSLIRANAGVLRSTEYLLVDLRGNEGGGSAMSNGLLPYVLGDSLDPVEHDFGDAVMLASPDQISYAKRAFGPDTSAFVRRIVAEMEAHPGELVLLSDPNEERPVDRPPTPIRGPRRVAVMIDGGTVSASEVMVLKALRTDRAVVIGEPTAGALDYQSTSIVRIHPDESQWLLGYPTITAHTQLPQGGMRGKGIQPEVPMRWAEVGDPYAAVMEVLRGR